MTEYNPITASADPEMSPAEDDVETRGAEKPSWRHVFWLNRRFLIILLTPVLCSPIAIIVANPVGYTAYSIVLMAVYWCTECIPLAATAMFPIILFPLFGIVDSTTVCSQYMKDINVLFFAGLMVAIAVEHWNLHKRIALVVLLMVGAKPRWLMLGFMITTAFLSMWMSNTATTAMMIPIAQAVLNELKETDVDEENGENVDDDVVTSDSTENNGNNKESLPTYQETIEMEDVNRENNFVTPKIYAPNPSTSTPNSTTNPSMLTSMLTPNFKSSRHDHEADAVSIKSINHIKSEASIAGSNAACSNHGDEEEEDHSYVYICKGIILSVPYAANIGGTGTLIGTGPNLVLIGQAESLFGTATGVNFGTYMLYAFPCMIVCLALTWIWLQIYYLDRWCCPGSRGKPRTPEQNARATAYIKKAHKQLGPMSYAEIVVFIHLCAIALLWLTRDPQFVPGWAIFFRKGYVTDSTAGMIVALSLFLFPSKPPKFICGYGNEENEDKKVKSLLEWHVVSHKMAWDVVFLLGGGFALAEGCKQSGLSDWLGAQLTILGVFSPEVMALLISIIVAFFSNVTSNTSTAAIFLPILAALSTSLGVNPLFLMISAAIACSFAFLLPVATPPNAIAFTCGFVTVFDMVKAGIVLNVLCILVSNASINTLGVWIFDVKTFPDWAKELATTATPEVLLNVTAAI
ncbi:Na(+)/citrate cotransporter-like [Amphiura filiformis]|uniref:Na(+)/citrate cotransporter-like n=1 Tax=Amphiura filiformis TaxID=82378 RepID=UPI003B227D05